MVHPLANPPAGFHALLGVECLVTGVAILTGITALAVSAITNNPVALKVGCYAMLAGTAGSGTLFTTLGIGFLKVAYQTRKNLVFIPLPQPDNNKSEQNN